MAFLKNINILNKNQKYKRFLCHKENIKLKISCYFLKENLKILDERGKKGGVIGGDVKIEKAG